MKPCATHHVKDEAVKRNSNRSWVEISRKGTIHKVDLSGVSPSGCRVTLQLSFDFWYVYILIKGDYIYPDQYEYYENPADNYYEDDCNNGSFDDNGWRTEESSQPEYSAIWAQFLELMGRNVVEEEVVGDNAPPDSAAFDVFEKVDNVDLVMSEPIPSPDDMVETVIGKGGVDDNTTPDRVIFENFEHFENKDLVMGDFIPPPDKTSCSLLVLIHLLDDDQEDDDNDVVFENNKHDFFGTHDPFMNGKLDVINTIDEDIRKHPDILPSNPILLENFYWYCRPKRQAVDNIQDTSRKRGAKQSLGAAMGVLHVKPGILKRYRRKDRAWRFKATSKHSCKIIRKQQPGSSRGTSKLFNPGNLEYIINEGTAVTGNQRSQMAYDPP
ncbi:hypothetical protein L2E82_30255 [Cichorium intybus]|uniref:Uncharacterized protein n=1 Tax=Cichorium intybus TaxID=13427 RepID=A0ACB9D065_CICIN|nr:hypothetical protein L2E82_30255 [Cichorium intybus]